MHSKDTLRRKVTTVLKTIPAGYFCDVGIQVVRYISSLPAWSECTSVLAFLSFKYEIDTEPAVGAALFAGKAVFVPRINGGNLCFYRIPSLNGPWERSPLGIREPLPRAAGLLHEGYFPALILTPGLAFTQSGKRLGRGKGFYDRFFAYLDGTEKSAGRYFALGLCLEAQIMPDLPVDGRDRPVHGVCTEKGIQVVPIA
ncbi:MAG: 5-formyltetrahydrofolate cyclo-ligase [Treponema sp.]|nr:5-formyltetrahydrofolate cyclo-ligase [Treponema sp.]